MNGKQAQVSNPCGTCGDVNCCKEYTIYISAHDIYRIVTNFPLPLNRYLQAFKTQNPPSGIMIRNRLRNKRFDLALKETGDRCIFFNNKETLHCGIHDIKPGVCKAYPFKLEGGQLVQNTEKKCPIDWKTDKEFNDSMILHLVQHRREWSFYYSLIDEWNSRIRLNRSLKYFLRFILQKVRDSETV